MEVVRADLLQEVLRDMSRCSKWPYVASFALVAGSVNALCIGSISRYWHLSLYDFIRDHTAGDLRVEIDSYDREIVMGIIE